MPSNLLATKLYPPAPLAIRVPRPRLVQRLNEGLAAGRPLALISAPAGFGKTACAGEWLSGLDLPVAWLSLDAADDDPARFFAYLVAALQRVDGNIARGVQAALQSGELPPAETIAAALLDDILRAPGKFLLALDDFQVIQDPAILSVIEKLVTYHPPQLHVLLLTREDPLLPLARLRANDQMTEIRAADLRFAGAEAEAFLRQVIGLSLAEEDVAALAERTEGWIVGLQLAGLSMRGREDASGFIAKLSGSHRYILSYLTEEVLARLPAEMKDFLLQTSILEALNGELCDAVTGRSDGSALLERLFKANLFLIPLDDEQRWYRYHHLFADLLRNLQARQPREATARLRQRASQWYEQAGLAAEAIEQALAAEDYARAVRLLEGHAMPTLTQGYARTVEGWVQAIPPEWRARSPRTNLAFAWLHLLRGSYERILPHLRLAEAALAGAGPVEDNPLRAEFLALQANLLNVQGNPGEGLEMARQALRLSAADDFFTRSLAYLGLGGAYRLMGDYAGLVEAYQNAIQFSQAAANPLPEMMAVAALTLAAIQHGQLRLAAQVAAQAVQRFETAGGAPPPISAPVYGVLGMVNYEWNRLEKAGEYLATATQLSKLSGHNAGLAYNRVFSARLNLAQGNLAEAARAAAEAAGLMQLGVPAWLRPEVAAQQVRVYLAQDDPLSAGEVLKGAGITLQGGLLADEIPGGHEPLYLAALRLELYHASAAGAEREPARLAEDLRLASRLAEGASRGRRGGLALQALLLRARIYAALGQASAALDDLLEALRLAEPEGYLRSFVDEGPGMAALLAAALRDERGRELESAIRALLAAFPAAEGASAGAQPAAWLVEPLTGRELEVLRLIAEGLKYEEIAARLFISLNTVRFFVKGIYSKLAVNNRTRAIEMAREMNLL